MSLFNSDKISIYRVINNNTGNEIGTLECESFLDIIDVVRRAQNKFNIDNPSDIRCIWVCDINR